MFCTLNVVDEVFSPHTILCILWIYLLCSFNSTVNNSCHRHCCHLSRVDHWLCEVSVGSGECSEYINLHLRSYVNSTCYYCWFI